MVDLAEVEELEVLFRFDFGATADVDAVVDGEILRKRPDVYRKRVDERAKTRVADIRTSESTD